MRYDDFRRSDDIEDRRDDSRRRHGRRRFRSADGRRRARHRHHHRARPRLLRLRHRSAHPDRRRGNSQRRRLDPDLLNPIAPRAPAKTGAPTDEMGNMIAGILGEIDDRWSEIFQASGQTYVGPKIVLFRNATNARALRHGAVGDGAVLLSARAARSFSTPDSSARSRPASTAARAMPANSPRPISSPMKPAITSRTCSASCRA